MQDHPDDFVAQALGRLPREMTPPPALEDATVASLKRARLLGSRAPGGFNFMTWMLAASIAGVAFVGGSLFATWLARPSPVRTVADSSGAGGDAARVHAVAQAADQPTFALLLYGSSNDSATHATHAAEYGAWAAMDHGAGRIIGGEAMGTPVASVWVKAVGLGTDSIIVDEGPLNGADFVGYFIVQARDRDAAVALARSCPHLKYGGRVVVRRVWPSSIAIAARTSSER